jgi:hypothetical protein
VIRPTNSISILIFTTYVLIAYRRYFLRYLAWSLLIGIPFLLFNLSLYHTVLSDYYRSYQDFNLGAGFGEALAGLWISPARGLLVYSPILICAAWGLWLNLKQQSTRRLDLALLAIVALHSVVLAIWRMWWGGWSYGPRMMTDMLPYLMYWLIPVIALLQRSGETPADVGPRIKHRLPVISAIAMLAGISWVINYRGATSTQTFEWNRAPANVDLFPQRLWDWRDIQFLRGLHRGQPVNLALSGVSLSYLGPEVYSRLGTTELRPRQFNAERALIAPPAPTWLILGEEQPIGLAIPPLLAGLTTELASQTLEDGTAFRLYSGELRPQVLEAVSRSQQAAAWSSKFLPAAVDVQPLSLPAHFGDMASLMGFEVQPVDVSGSLRVTSYWQAAEPSTTPLTMFIHAIDSNGEVVAQEDRLDAPSEEWHSGDLIVQVQRFTLPPSAGTVWLELGLYRSDTGERLPVLVDGQIVDSRVLLGQANFP